MTTPVAIKWGLTSKGMSGFCQCSSDHLERKKDCGQPCWCLLNNLPCTETGQRWVCKKMHSQNTPWAGRRAVAPAELEILSRNPIHMFSFPYTNLVKGKGYVFRLKKAGKLIRLMTATQESVPSVRDDICTDKRSETQSTG